MAVGIFVKSIKVSDLGTCYSIVKDSNADLTVKIETSKSALVKKLLFQLKYSKLYLFFSQKYQTIDKYAKRKFEF